MTYLNIQQGLNVEVVSTLIIKKLYDAAQSVPLPEEGEQDLANMSGNLLVDKTYRTYVSYLITRFPDLHINVTTSYYIPFEDSNVLSVLMANNISSDGVGITEADAANANIGTIFKNNTTITSFNTFEYFNRANTSPANEMFNGCTNLSSVDFSDTSSIANLLFCNTALTTLNIPNLQILSGVSQFKLCTKLTEVLNLGSITSIPASMFDGCSLLTNVVLPELCVSIGSGAFRYNTSLLNINLQNIITIGYEGFRQSHLSGVLNLPKLTTIAGSVFDGCNFLTGVECLGKISTIPNVHLFYRTGITYAKIPYECTTIGDGAFQDCANLTSVKQYTDSIDNWVEGEEPTTGPLSRVTSFGNECFRDCSSLTLTLQDIQNATTIGLNAFRSTLLSGDIVLPQLSTIGFGAFFETQITSIDLAGSSISSLPLYVFYNCSSLSKISIPTSVTYLDQHWGDGIANVVTLEGFDNCVSHYLYNWRLYNKTILNPIKTSFVSDDAIMSLWSNTTDINYNLLYNPSQTSTSAGYCLNNSHQYYTYFTERPTGGSSRVNIGLLYFRDISSFGALTFYKCNINNLVINNATPPTLNYSTEASWRYYNTQVWDNNIFPTGNSDQNDNVVIGTLWVPDSAVATYQANPLYYHLNIKGINTKTNGTDYDLPRYATYAAWKVAEEAAVAQNGHAVTGIIEEYM